MKTCGRKTGMTFVSWRNMSIFYMFISQSCIVQSFDIGKQNDSWYLYAYVNRISLIYISYFILHWTYKWQCECQYKWQWTSYSHFFYFKEQLLNQNSGIDLWIKWLFTGKKIVSLSLERRSHRGGTIYLIDSGTNGIPWNNWENSWHVKV